LKLGLAVDIKDNVYILTRGLDPVLVYGCDGNFIRCWEREFASWPHGLYITPDVSFYPQMATIL
jgi:hypothetical protein